MPKKEPLYLIHQHHATHLHYDFRLEIDGVLKSWALKELPLKPSHPVMAIQVADHSIKYGSFEGIIPPFHYGAGPVIIWDQGTFTHFTIDYSQRTLSLEQAEKQGYIAFSIHAKKLHGSYLLLRITKKQKWLLIKLYDDHVLKGRKPSSWNKSVISGKTLEQIFNAQSKITYQKWLSTGANIRYKKQKQYNLLGN